MVILIIKDMKKYKHLILAMLTLLAISCNKKNDDVIVTTESLLIGVWQPTNIGTICSSGNNDEFVYTTCMLTSRTTFSEDGSYQDILNIDVLGECENSYTLTGTWAIVNENVQVIFSDGQQLIFSIIQIDDNTLKLSLEGGGPDSFCNDGSTVIRNYVEYVKVE